MNTPDGLRVNYVYDTGGNVLEERRSEGESETQYYTTDQRGAAVQLTGENGRTIWSGEYDPYGRCDESGEEVGQQPIRLMGQLHDEATGLSHHRFRVFDPESARFISPDPIGIFGGDNAFGYPPDPVSYADPFGLAYSTWQIHSPGNDEMIQKGIHFYSPSGLELSVRPDHQGGITFTNSIPGYSSDPRLPGAIKSAQAHYESNSRFRQDILSKARDGVSAVLSFRDVQTTQSLHDLANGRSRELRDIERNVGRRCQ